MRYKELLKLGWALTWREMAWCTVVCLPAVMVMGLLFDALGLQKATNPAVFFVAFAVTMIVAVRAVVAIMLRIPYRCFRLEIVRET